MMPQHTFLTGIVLLMVGLSLQQLYVLNLPFALNVICFASINWFLFCWVMGILNKISEKKEDTES